jgi:chromate transporter
MSLSDINFISIILVSVGVFVLRKYKMDPIKVMIATGIVGIFIYGVM